MTSAAAPRHPGAWTLPEMAPDQPLLPDFHSRPGALQRLGILVVASEIVLNHLDCVENGVANPYARNTVRILARVPRNWTPLLVTDIDNFGREMLDKAFFPNGILAGEAPNIDEIAPNMSDWARGARQVIAMMCPPRRWSDAITALDKRHDGTGELDRQEIKESRARIEAFALQHPVAAIHAAAAQVAWLSLQSKVVPDWTARRTEIAVKMDEMKHKITTHRSRA